jgi:beta-glucanase (GH16 family)
MSKKMRHVAGLLLLSILMLGPSACDSQSDKAAPEVVIEAPPGWTLVWNDEFDGSSIDPTKWEHEVNANGGGNNELQYYTARSKNSRVEDGHLVIEAHKESYKGDEGTREYTSARMRTRGKGDWVYGRMEIRARLPYGQGIWPAIWMLPTDWEYGGWPRSGEIDIMEILGHDPDNVHGTLHFGRAANDKSQDGGSLQMPEGSLRSEFHTYTVEWKEDEIRWYVDDLQYGRVTNWYAPDNTFPAPFDKRFHMLLNVAVGGNWPGSPDASTVFPQRMEVDYVRVFEKDSN